jgi:hypothetical protein
LENGSIVLRSLERRGVLVGPSPHGGKPSPDDGSGAMTKGARFCSIGVHGVNDFFLLAYLSKKMGWGVKPLIVVIPVRDVPDVGGNWSGPQGDYNGAFRSRCRASNLPPTIKELDLEKNFFTVLPVVYTVMEGGFICDLWACGKDIEYLGLLPKLVEEI